MDVKWTTYAANDLISIESHIARDSIQYSLVVVDRILDRALQLESFPESGSIVPEYERVDIREIFVHSYRIIHQVHTDHVRILTVCHGANPLPRTLPEIR
jgi:plasmid stabilization system protein ParE